MVFVIGAKSKTKTKYKTVQKTDILKYPNNPNTPLSPVWCNQFLWNKKKSCAKSQSDIRHRHIYSTCIKPILML